MNQPPAETSVKSAKGVTPIDREREFDKNELFFSTTDPKGIILDGNGVFVRVSAFSYEELIGRPHNIIRHPDMPRAVFKLLWDTIGAGKTIAAYVKNMAKDGSYYWVMAVVSPVPNGYLSIRFKPSTALFHAAQAIYAQLLSTEKRIEQAGSSSKEAMEASTQVLLSMLQESGFKDYDSFMWAAISDEIENRACDLNKARSIKGDGMSSPARTSLCRILENCRHIEGGLDGLSTSVDGLRRLNAQLNEQSKFIEDLAQAVRLVSFNAMVEANRLNYAGATLGIIAERMAGHSDAIANCIPVLQAQIANLLPILQKTIFDVCICRLTISMASAFCVEILDFPLDESASHKAWGNVRILVGKTFCRTWDKAISSFSTLSAGISKLGTEMASLQDAIRSLEFVQISGRVEASRLENPQAFDTIFAQVAKRATDARSHAHGFKDQLDRLIEELAANVRHEKEISASLAQIDLELKHAAKISNAEL